MPSIKGPRDIGKPAHFTCLWTRYFSKLNGKTFSFADFAVSFIFISLLTWQILNFETYNKTKQNRFKCPYCPTDQHANQTKVLNIP